MSGLSRDPEKAAAWAMRSRKPLKRSPLKRIGDRRKAENRRRREILHVTYGSHPRCFLCPLLRERGVDTGCNGWADDGDEFLRRSAGGSITDPANVRPVGRRCHDWATAHPKQMRDWKLEGSRYGGAA